MHYTICLYLLRRAGFTSIQVATESKSRLTSSAATHVRYQIGIGCGDKDSLVVDGTPDFFLEGWYPWTKDKDLFITFY